MQTFKSKLEMNIFRVKTLEFITNERSNPLVSLIFDPNLKIARSVTKIHHRKARCVQKLLQPKSLPC